MTMQDEIVRGVEATRAKIAERHGYDVKEISVYLRKRAAERRVTQDKPKAPLSKRNLIPAISSC